MNKLPPAVEKYLARQSAGSWKIEAAENENKKFHLAVVVPAIDELTGLKILLDSLSQNESSCFANTIIIIVVNNSINAPDEIKKTNHKTIEWLKRLAHGMPGDETDNRIISLGLNLAFIDASSEGCALPPKDAGVGLARKIGMDAALKLFDYSEQKNNSIACLDADCTIRQNYITDVYTNFINKKLSAAVVEYEHPLTTKGEALEAIVCYELFLRYYRLGLKFADSPYALHTIGSTMVCNCDSYIKAGGMNKRKAAEDFYFLERLAKLGNVNTIRTTKVFPSPRGSWRVPFGTGQRVNRFLSKVQNEHVLYSPRSFEVLRLWLKLFMGDKNRNSEAYLYEAKEISAALYSFLIGQNFDKEWGRIYSNSKTNEQLAKQKKSWFDGFRTLKLIHYLRDKEFPLAHMFDAIDDLLERMNVPFPGSPKGEIPPIEKQIEYLKLLRNIP